MDLVYWTDEEVTGGGPFYRASDVLAWRASIRAAVDAERKAGDADFDGAPTWVAFRDARAALDALLADGDA